MDAHSCRALGVLAVKVVRQGDVDGIHSATREAFLVLIIRETAFHLVAAAELFQLLRIVGDEGSELRVLSMSKRRQDGYLSDMPQPNHAVADLSLVSGFSGRLPCGGHRYPTGSTKETGLLCNSQGSPESLRRRISPGT